MKLNKLRVNDCFVYNKTISNNSIRKHKKSKIVLIPQ